MTKDVQKETRVPKPIKDTVLEVLRSFEIGLPIPEDKKYVQQQRIADGDEDMPQCLMEMSWLHCLLSMNYGLTINKKQFTIYVYALWKDGLIRIQQLEDGVYERIKYTLHPTRNVLEGAQAIFLQISESGGRYIQEKDEVKSQKSGSRLRICFKTDPIRFICEETGQFVKFQNENSQNTMLIRAAYSPENVGIWIDLANDILNPPEEDEPSFEGREIYDAARDINKKFQKKFGLNEALFEFGGNMRVRLNPLPQTFKIIQK